jgi:hypothetical protein
MRARRDTREDFLGTDTENVYDYHYQQMMLRVNNRLYKLHAVTSYRVPKQVSYECFKIFVFSLPAIMFKTTTVYNSSM